jgi:asparagine synthase (glutamine-hydrolysing)
VTAEEFKQAFSYLLHLKQEPLSVPNEVLLYLIGVKARKDGVKVLLSGEGADEFFAGYDRIFSWAKMQKNLLIEEFAQLYCYGREAPTNTIKQALSEAFESCFLSSVFEKVRWFFIKFHLPVLLRRLDFSLMAAGVEGREPIANQHMFDLCKGLSSDVLIHKQLGKNPLRKLASRYFGDEFGYAQKIGFPVDMRQVYQELNSFTSYEIWFNKNIEVLS